MGNEYQKFNKVLDNSWGKLIKATWSRDLTMALGLSKLERDMGAASFNRSTDSPSYSVC